MVTRAPILTTPYGGYFHREVPEEDTELSHVGPDTPCGEYLRRFWQPICFSDELKDLPHRVKSSARSWWRFATGAAPLASWNCIVRIAARLWSTG
jgi:hypothetical protein